MASSLDLGALRISVEADSSKAEKQLENLKDKVEDTGKSSEKSGGLFSKFKSALKKNVDDASKQSVEKLSALKIAMGNLISQGISKLASAISNNLGSAFSRVDTMNNYKKSMEALGFTTKDAEEAIDSICDTIQPLPIALDEAVASSQKFVAMYDDIEKGTEVWEDVTNMAYSAGQGSEAAARGSEAWYKMLARGKPDMEHWQATVETMPAQLGQLAKAMLGNQATSQDLYEAWSSGAVTSEELTEAMHKMSTEGVDGMTSWAEQAKTANAGIQTSMENVKLAITRNLANAIAPFSENIVNISTKVVDTIDKIGGNVKKAAENIQKSLKSTDPSKIVGTITTNIVNLVKKVPEQLLKIVTSGLESLADNLEGEGGSMISDSFVDLFETAFKALVRALPSLIRNTIRVAIALLQRSIEAGANLVKNAFLAIWNKLVSSAKKAWEGFKNYVKQRVQIVINTGPIQTLISWVKSAISWWNDLKDKLSHPIKAVINTFRKGGGNSGGADEHPSRIGIRKVPYDDYPATLHKNETVLTATESALYEKAMENFLNSKNLVEDRPQPVTNTSNNYYSFGNITVDVSKLEDVQTVTQFVEMMKQAREFV